MTKKGEFRNDGRYFNMTRGLLNRYKRRISVFHGFDDINDTFSGSTVSLLKNCNLRVQDY